MKPILWTRILTGLVLTACDAHGDPERPASPPSTMTSVTDILRMDGTVVTETGSTLVRHARERIGASVTVSGIEGEVINVWWLIFNRPEACTVGWGRFRCGPDDLARADGTQSLMATGVVGSTGFADLGGVLNRGDGGLTDVRGADVLLLVQNHGPIPFYGASVSELFGRDDPEHYAQYAMHPADNLGVTDDPPQYDEAPVYWWDHDQDNIPDFDGRHFDRRVPVNGSTSKLMRTQTRLYATLDLTEPLDRKEVVTAWWMLFNRPDACTDPNPPAPSGCGPADLLRQDAGPAIIWAIGTMPHFDRPTRFSMTLDPQQIRHSVNGLALESPLQAFVHLVIRRHGQLTHTGTPSPSIFYQPSGGCAGSCPNAFFAVHADD